MISKFALIAALLATSAAGWLAWSNGRLRVDNAALTRNVAALTISAEIAEAARAIAAQQAAQQAARAAESQKIIEALLTGDFENADTLVDPAIARLLDCLRNPTSRTDCGAH